MRTTLSLDDDVAALLEEVRKSRAASLKQVVNEALRQGLERMSQPAAPRKPFRTRPVDLGKCYFPNLDNSWEVIAEAEGEGTTK
jgi:hypothetical protein